MANKMSRDLELEKQIDAYIKGKLTDEQALRLWKRLLRRPDYIELLETELGIQSLQEKQQTQGGNSAGSTGDRSTIYHLQKSWKWIAAAASFIILVVAMNFLRFDSQPTGSELAVKEINLVRNLSSAQILRSQMTILSPADSLLNRGYQAAISGRIAEAMKLYDRIIHEYGDQPAAVKAYMNRGIIHYNTGSFAKAIGSFKAVLKKAEEEVFIMEKAYWYLGNAYLQTEQPGLARKAIHSASVLDGVFSRPASRLLRKLDRRLENAQDPVEE